MDLTRFVMLVYRADEQVRIADFRLRDPQRQNWSLVNEVLRTMPEGWKPIAIEWKTPTDRLRLYLHEEGRIVRDPKAILRRRQEFYALTGTAEPTSY